MRKLLERYIARTIFASTSLVTLVLCCLVFIMTLLGELKSVGTGDYTLTEALIYTLLHLLNDLYQFSPLLLLLGCMVGLSFLTAHRELSVMRTSGFSLWQVVKSILIAAIFIVILMSALGEVISPHLSYLAEVRKENTQNAGSLVVTASGVWFHIDNNFIHVQRVIGRDRLEGVTRYQFNNTRQLEVAYYANALTYHDHAWWMEEGTKTTFSKDHTASETFKTVAWNLPFNTNLLTVDLVQPDQMSLPKLYQFMRYLKQNGLQANEYEYDFWKRVFQPLAALIMVFLAVPFVLGRLGELHPGVRMLIALLVGFSFFILDAMLAQMSIVYQLPVAIAAFLPLLLFAVLGGVLAHRLLK